MSLFKPDGLGEKVKCGNCSSTYYLLESGVDILGLEKKRYFPATLLRCDACGGYICENCRRFGVFRCKCGASRFTTARAAYKSKVH